MNRALRLGGLFLCCLLTVFSCATAYAKTEVDEWTFYLDGYQDKKAACGGSTILSGSQAAEQIWNFLIGKGLSPEQTAGFMGNMQAESHFEPRLVEYGYPNSRGEVSKAGKQSSLDDEVPPDSNSKGQPGYGIVQWTAPNRKQGLRDLVAQRGVKGGDLATQLDYLWQELNAGYKNSVLIPLQATNDVNEASDIVLEKFERPAGIEKQRPIRRNNANNILAQYGSGTGSETTPVAPATGGCSGAALDASGCPTAPVGESDVVTAEGTTIKVHPCIAGEVSRVVNLAKSQGIDLNTGTGGYRSKESQERLRAEHGCGGSRVYDDSCKAKPPTAVPGKSRHERGTAVDFACGGGSISNHSNKCFIFLRDNTHLKNLASEPWHWSIDGG